MSGLGEYLQAGQEWYDRESVNFARYLMRSAGAGTSFTCPRCGMVSYHPKDIEYGYCGNCHDYTGGGIIQGLPILGDMFMSGDFDKKVCCGARTGEPHEVGCRGVEIRPLGVSQPAYGPTPLPVREPEHPMAAESLGYSVRHIFVTEYGDAVHPFSLGGGEDYCCARFCGVRVDGLTILLTFLVESEA